MSKSKFDVTETAKKFISDIKEPEVKEEMISDNENMAGKPKQKRARGKDKETGEKTIQVGFYITDEQNMNIAMAAVKMKKDKSSLVREALTLYIDKLSEEGIL
jgi:hypothetical protein